MDKRISPLFHNRKRAPSRLASRPRLIIFLMVIKRTFIRFRSDECSATQIYAFPLNKTDACARSSDKTINSVARVLFKLWIINEITIRPIWINDMVGFYVSAISSRSSFFDKTSGEIAKMKRIYLYDIIHNAQRKRNSERANANGASCAINIRHWMSISSGCISLIVYAIKSVRDICIHDDSTSQSYSLFRIYIVNEEYNWIHGKLLEVCAQCERSMALKSRTKQNIIYKRTPKRGREHTNHTKLNTNTEYSKYTSIANQPNFICMCEKHKLKLKSGKNMRAWIVMW